METYGKQILGVFSNERRLLGELAHTDYTEEDIRKKVSFLGGKLELFLKTIVFPASSSSGNLVSFISKAKNQGLPISEYQKLDSFRKLYNIAKHEPNASISLIETTKKLVDANAALKQLIDLNLGLTSLVVRPQSKRVFWIAAWDNFVGGITEIHIIIPGVSEHWLGPPTMDSIYINISDWGDFKSDLKEVGGLHSGFGIIPEKQIELFETDSDFLDSFAFEGEYRELLLITSKFERQQSRHPHLHRNNSSYSTLLVLLLALIDVLPTVDTSKLAEEIRTQAVNLYGLSSDSPELDEKIHLLVEMANMVPNSLIGSVKGPLWLSPERFDEEKGSAIAKHSSLPIIVTKHLAIAMEWKV
ncbi:hypothetical protein HCU01_19220 [Halomonas cupida]|uniref:Uncharacterized protein n=1 Tax=Halomonas cupida TaxID=44933 RepID=A0A1M7I0N8_9GAMM|nr:hypothetical protein [Halomonas cupida]GEN23973.1 hypothetical protein HCU01_19220 [Halomonas cupida]SHM34280.1 hypothetical protein SAMN05660971_02760 [Halomonas cupida]